MFWLLLAITASQVQLCSAIPFWQLNKRSPFVDQVGVNVQLFGWSWDSVAAECEFLASVGFKYVQVSPPSEHINGTQWWTDYQPVSYLLNSKRGNRTQFTNMVNKCRSQGVDVIADVVLNHMTAAPSTGSSAGFSGSAYSKYTYSTPSYTQESFHYCNGNGTTRSIENYSNATEVFECELQGLADLDQSQVSVQRTLTLYLNELLSLGVAGFRFDAAKHVNPSDLAAIQSRLSKPFVAIQEVQSGGAVQSSQYELTGQVIEFSAPQAALTYFTNGNLFGLLGLGDSSWNVLPSSTAAYIMSNQDLERSGAALTFASAHNAYTLAAIFMLAFNYGTPTLYSSYQYDTFDQGAPSDARNLTEPATCYVNGWRCEHRWPALANMVQWHNAVGSSNITMVTQGAVPDQIAFGRGSTGFVAINNSNSTWNATFASPLAPGYYCDLIHDTDPAPSSCAGTNITVDMTGRFSAAISPYDALALMHNPPPKAMKSESRQVRSAGRISFYALLFWSILLYHLESH